MKKIFVMFALMTGAVSAFAQESCGGKGRRCGECYPRKGGGQEFP